MAGVVSRRGLVVGVAGSLAAPAVRAQPAPSADADAVPDEEAFTPTLAAPNRPIPVGPERHIWIINNANEEVAVAYRSGEAHSPLAMSRLQNAFRDLREQTPGPLPELLIDMLSLLQEKYRYTRPLRVISGYRTLRTNMSLEHAAPNSFHLYGYAADFYMPGSRSSTSRSRRSRSPTASASWASASTGSSCTWMSVPRAPGRTSPPDTRLIKSGPAASEAGRGRECGPPAVSEADPPVVRRAKQTGGLRPAHEGQQE